MVELGRKYECPDCEVKFYDLGRPQAVCPKCGTDLKGNEDEPEAKSPPPRSAPRPEARTEVAEVEEVETDADVSDDDDDDLEELEEIVDDDDDDDEEFDED